MLPSNQIPAPVRPVLSLSAQAELAANGQPTPSSPLCSPASLAANIAAAQPDLAGRVIAAWPSFALMASYELLMRQVRQSAAARATPADAAKPEASGLASMKPGRLPLRRVSIRPVPEPG